MGRSHRHYKKVIERVVQLHDMAKDAFGLIKPLPEINFKARGETAGMADFTSNTLSFNPAYIDNYEEQFLTHSVGHEHGHLWAFGAFGSHQFPHGSEWQYVMNVFGLPPVVDHDYDTSLASGKRYTMWCDCRQHIVGTRRFNDITVRGHEYECSSCNQLITATRPVADLQIESIAKLLKAVDQQMKSYHQ